MSKTKFTPGPWVVSKYYNNDIFESKPVRDWAETLAEADATLAKAKAIDAEETR